MKHILTRLAQKMLYNAVSTDNEMLFVLKRIATVQLVRIINLIWGIEK